MTSISCPHCSRAGILKVAVPPGTKVRCPACRETFITPDDDSDPGIGVADHATGLNPLSSAMPGDPNAYDPIIPPSQTTRTPTTHSPHHLTPPEPWYYGWIERYAKGTWFFCRLLLIFDAVCLALFIVIGFVKAWMNDSFHVYNPLIVACGVAHLILWLTLLPTFLFAALLMLGVDAARNVRAARFR